MATGKMRNHEKLLSKLGFGVSHHILFSEYFRNVFCCHQKLQRELKFSALLLQQVENKIENML